MHPGVEQRLLCGMHHLSPAAPAAAPFNTPTLCTEGSASALEKCAKDVFSLPQQHECNSAAGMPAS